MLGIVTDYSCEAQTVFRNATGKLLTAGYLEIIALACFPRRLDNLPSWTPDWSTPRVNTFNLMIHNPGAHHKVASGSVAVKGNALTISGCALGIITQMAPKWQDGSNIFHWLPAMKILLLGDGIDSNKEANSLGSHPGRRHLVQLKPNETNSSKCLRNHVKSSRWGASQYETEQIGYNDPRTRVWTLSCRINASRNVRCRAFRMDSNCLSGWYLMSCVKGTQLSCLTVLERPVFCDLLTNLTKALRI
jgi:hypothetical protein